MRLRLLLIPLFLLFFEFLNAHPLRLSLCEIEFSSDTQSLSIHLKLFLTDVNEALVFDPNSQELAFCQPQEPEKANDLLLEYLDRFFYVKANGEKVALQIQRKRLSGEGENTALWVYFESTNLEVLQSLEVKNTVFTDLFFDQNNIVYIHADTESKSAMLNKKTEVYITQF